MKTGRWFQRIPGTEEGWKYMEVTEIITDGCDCYPWHEVFLIFPRKSINGKWMWWRKAYKRKIWLVWGVSFHMEPEVQYADLLDLVGLDL